MFMYLLIAGVLATIPVALVVGQVLLPAPQERALQDRRKTQPKRPSRQELRAARAGNAVDLGREKATGVPFVLSEPVRYQHVLNLGSTGFGKSTLQRDIFLRQDIADTENT